MPESLTTKASKHAQPQPKSAVVERWRLGHEGLREQLSSANGPDLLEVHSIMNSIREDVEKYHAELSKDDIYILLQLLQQYIYFITINNTYKSNKFYDEILCEISKIYNAANKSKNTTLRDTLYYFIIKLSTNDCNKLATDGTIEEESLGETHNTFRLLAEALTSARTEAPALAREIEVILAKAKSGITAYSESALPKLSVAELAELREHAKKHPWVLDALGRNEEAVAAYDEVFKRFGNSDETLSLLIVAEAKRLLETLSLENTNSYESNHPIELGSAGAHNSNITNNTFDHGRLSALTRAFKLALIDLKSAARHACLKEYYFPLPSNSERAVSGEETGARKQKKKTWSEFKGDDPSPERFREWLDETFPDRREIGMVLGDLKHLDVDAYKKAIEWRTKRQGIPTEVFETFGLPSDRQPYDPERDANAPRTMAEVRERAARGEDSEKNLTRALSRAWHHRPA